MGFVDGFVDGQSRIGLFFKNTTMQKKGALEISEKFSVALELSGRELVELMVIVWEHCLGTAGRRAAGGGPRSSQPSSGQPARKGSRARQTQAPLFRAHGVPEQNQGRPRLAHQERRLCPTSVQRQTD